MDKQDYIEKLDEEILQKRSLDKIDDDLNETTDISSKVTEIVGKIETECKENIAANNSAVGVTRNSSPQLQSTHLCITKSFILGPELNWKWTAFARGEVTKDKSTKG